MRGSTDSAKSISRAEPNQPTLQQYREAHKRADTFCREVQAFVEEAGIPAVNELRYAGYHLLAALGDDGKIVDPSNLTKAINHANRACYEAGEAGILIALDKIADFKNDYRDVAISSVIRDYMNILQVAENAKQRVVSERSHGDDQIADHGAFIDHFKTLRECCATLELGREELNKVIIKDRTDSRRFIFGIMATILAIIVAILLGAPQIVRLYEDAHPKTPTAATPHKG